MDRARSIGKKFAIALIDPPLPILTTCNGWLRQLTPFGFLNAVTENGDTRHGRRSRTVVSWFRGFELCLHTQVGPARPQRQLGEYRISPDPSPALTSVLRAAAKPKQKRILTCHEMWREDSIKKREDRASQPVERIDSST
jgi:hypothetical protein